MNKYTLWKHRKGWHTFTIPIRIVETQDYHIEGVGTVVYEEKVSFHRVMKCLHCNKRHQKYIKSVTTVVHRGGW